MKIRVLPLLVLLCASVGLGVRPAAGAAVSFSAGIDIHAAADFYAPLSSYGAWVDVGSYGRCWHPSRIEAGWRPYTLGHWEYTDVGWYWVTDEPFGWATYHYGSWVEDPQYGWVWVPGTEWSPAWVTWRESDSYIGWAPCGPSLAVAAPSLFVFVEFGHFCDPIRPSTVIVNNTRIINNTRIVNNFRSESRRFDGGQRTMRVNAGPDVTRVQHATGRNLSPTPIATAVQKTPMPSNMKHSTEQPARERSTANPEQQGRERSVTTPEKPAVREPSGAARESKPAQREESAPSTPRQPPAASAPRPAPAPEKPAMK
ncbi:MAG: DUF6600 domain-containing protein, partial [Limisphaerales bacterium]